MPLDPRAQRLLSMLAAAAPAERERPSPEQRRQSLAKLMQFSRNDVGPVTTTDGRCYGPAGALHYRMYTPAPAGELAQYDDGALLPGFVYFHGGGLVAGSIETHDKVAAALAVASGCRLLSFDYRLAPEHKFPAAVDDALAAVEFVVRHGALLGVDSNRVVIGGDSAGATLAAFLCQYAASVGGPRIAAQCLICPVLDSSEPWPSRGLFGTGYLLDKATWEADLADYLAPDIPLDEPVVSPLSNPVLIGLPPAVIHTAEFDPMRDEGNAYAVRLADAGVSVAHVCHEGMIHNFHALGALLPQARPALELIGHQLRSLLHAPAPS
ncbi:putative lipase/esterase [Bradyrhizobium sp. ORS 285]|uniref:alpha/beta hydrolase n=1 Tax=Bradyrhizobium sp. ORS 285 TaxID=115808 RepID=UPI00024084FA|nr:alpha/beta hydrolase [Bradyrhizobium sp. ORS 285]CCD89736.1 putative lipase/esterase [Bradyrhizobium sp. ORS 285]SMX61681.1 putative lipase/esterase [Bradyrhizobium sp. ORS 285]